MSDPRPIGVFDSGVGGLTVLREILRRTPAESTVYLGDNARAPYGVRPDDEVVAFSTQCLDALVERDVKALVVACNTSTAVALTVLRRRYDLPVLGVIPPGASAAALSTRERRVGVIATPATIRSPRLLRRDRDENPAVEVHEHATPRWCRSSRRGARPAGRGDRARGAGAAPGRARRRRRVHLPAAARSGDRYALLLGCTHYPAAAAAHRGGRRTGHRHRGLSGVDRLRAGRAARESTASRRPTTAPRDAPAADDGRPGASAARRPKLFGADFPDVTAIDLAVAAR
jgi:glutamate racemase